MKPATPEYRTFITDTGGHCWRCGRTARDRPAWWHAEWAIDPHHIVNKPRRNDRRAVISLCRRCHDVQHTGPFKADPDKFGKLDLPELLAIKRYVDEAFCDRAFLLTCIIGVYLPPEASFERACEVSWAVRKIRGKS